MDAPTSRSASATSPDGWVTALRPAVTASPGRGGTAACIVAARGRAPSRRTGARGDQEEWCVSVYIPCPNCGPRPYSEFAFGGEVRDLRSADAAADFRRVYLRDNAAGDQSERWFHSFGCRRWLTLTRDTITNRIDGGLDARP